MPTAGGQILWSDTQTLAVAVDSLAVTMSTPGYTTLVDDDTTPFALTTLPTVEFVVEFQLQEATGDTDYVPTVDRQVLKEDIQYSGGELTLDEPLATLASTGELYFLHEADDCWCKTLFKVAENGDSGYRLVEVMEPEWKCSCQTLKVPAIGDLLDENQHIIPSAYALDWSIRDNEGHASNWWDVGNKCEGGPEDCHYEFTPLEDPDDNAALVTAQRKMSGQWLWAIRKKWYDALYDKLDYILQCENNCGAEADSVYKVGETETYIPEGCDVTLCDILWTMKQGGATEGPGCLVDECKRPWNELACEGENCTGFGSSPKFYALTLNQLQDLIDNIGTWVKPKSGECECVNCSGECPTPILECISVARSKAACGVYDETETVIYTTVTTVHANGLTETVVWAIDPETGYCESTLTCGAGNFINYTYEIQPPGPVDESDSGSGGGYANPTGFPYFGSWNYAYTWSSSTVYSDVVYEYIDSYDYDVNCNATHTCSGNYSLTVVDTYEVDYSGDMTHTDPPDDEYTSVTRVYSGSWTWVIDPDPEVSPSCVFEGTVVISGNEDEESNGTFDLAEPWLPSGVGVEYIPPDGTPSVTYTVPADLTLGDWPDYPAWTSGPLEVGQYRSCGATRDWDPTNRYEKKFKWRIKHAPSESCYLKVWISTVFTPDGGPPDAPVISEYLWEGTTPCAEFGDPDVEGAETEIDPPEENGSIDVTILKWSCLESYEPDISDPENPQPNGFPDPDWEPEAP